MTTAHDEAADALASIAEGYGDGTRLGMRVLARWLHVVLTTAARSPANAEARRRLRDAGRYAARCRAGAKGRDAMRTTDDT